MVRTLSISLPQLALALLGPGACLYYCRSRGGYWKAVAPIGYARTEHDHPDPYTALAAAAAMVIGYHQLQAEEAARDTPAARAAYRAAWDASAGQPVAVRFKAANAAWAAVADTVEQPTSEEDEEEESACCDMCDGRGLGGAGCPQCGARFGATDY